MADGDDADLIPEEIRGMSFEEALRALEAWCLRSGVEYLRTSTAIAFEDLVLKYLRQSAHLR